MLRYLQKIRKSHSLMQSLFLLLSTLTGMAFLLGANSIISRHLSKSEFGDYSLILNTFTFFQTIFNFGLFYSFSRLIAVSSDKNKVRELYGLGLITVIFLGLGMSLAIFTYGYYQKVIGNLILYNLLLICLPFSSIFLLNNFNELLLQSNNRIKLLSFSRATPRILYLSALFTITYALTKTSLSVGELILLYIVCQIIPYVFILLKLKPKFKNLSSNWFEVKNANREFGFNIYLGSIVAVGASSLSGLLISFFSHNNQDVGFYAIALQFSAPLALIPNIIATVSFKKFANSTVIQFKLISFTVLLSLACIIFVLVFGKFIVQFVYGVKYVDAVNFLNLSAIGATLYGISDFFNRFLLAKGKGKELRNASIIVGGVLLLSNFGLIKIYGGIGASISSIIAGVIYLLIIIFYYKKFEGEKNG